MTSPGASLRRLTCLATAFLALAATVPAAASAYWDFSGYLHNYPTQRYEYGEVNPDTASWGFRLSRNNCEAKALFGVRSNSNVVQVNIPGGCTNLDWPVYYDAHYYYFSDAKNTDEGCCDVFVNVRVDATL
jgi:hypothetical protein